MDLKRLQALLDAKAKTQGNVEITAQELAALVQASGTENEGLKKSAKALEGEPSTPVVLQYKDFAELMASIAPQPKPPTKTEAVPSVPPPPK